MIDLLFVYGTLMQPGNPFADYLQRNCTIVSAGTTKGTLYDVGEYPGLVLVNDAKGLVHGTVVELHNPEENLKVIDDYEGVGFNQQQPNLYIREIVSIYTPNGVVDAWVYTYNLPVKGLPIISSGNYLEHIKQKKSPGN